MIKIIYDQSVKNLGKKIGSNKKAVPAAGTTSALNGYLGTSLLKLVLKVSRKKLDEKSIKKIENKLKKAENNFLALMEEDIKAYKINSQLQFKDKKNLKKLIEVPLKILKNSEDILNLQEKFNNNIKSTVIADYETAIENLKTAKKGAKIIIECNLQLFDENSNYINKIIKEINS